MPKNVSDVKARSLIWRKLWLARVNLSFTKPVSSVQDAREISANLVLIQPEFMPLNLQVLSLNLQGTCIVKDVTWKNSWISLLDLVLGLKSQPSSQKKVCTYNSFIKVPFVFCLIW